jgi:hypothetical protein
MKEYSYTSTPLWAFRPVTGYLYLYLSTCLHVSKPRVHLHEDGCIFSYDKVRLHASV